MSKLMAITDRLCIREREERDNEFIYQLFIQVLSSSKQEDDKYAKQCREFCLSELCAPDIFSAVLYLKDSGIFVGRICMQHIHDPIPELGIDILEKHQNHGYGPEAIIAFCNWYSATYGIKEVKVRIRQTNTHSAHVFEKIGANFENASSYLSQDMLNLLKRELPSSDLSLLEELDIRNYSLQLPIPE